MASMQDVKKEVARQLAESCATLAHDVSTSLGKLLECTEILLAEAKTRGSQKEGDLWESFKNNILTVRSRAAALSRIEDGGPSLTTEPLAINGMLRRVTQQYETAAQGRRVALALCLQEGLPLLQENLLPLEQVFANLVHYALQGTAEKGMVTVSSTQQDGEMVVTIVDTGPGIAPEAVPFVFEQYWRTEQARGQEGTKSGLGAVKKLVETCGGRVKVESSFGQGSCVSVFLPVPPVGQAGA
ncbi:MAG: sensor histidine kinase [Candidatus Binatia bacterium]